MKNALLVALLAVVMGACSKTGLNKIIQSGDPEQMYSTAMKLYDAKKWNKAATMFDACAHYYIGSEREDSIAFFNARCKYKARDYSEASTMLDEFRRKFGRSIFIEDAEGMYALCYYYLSPGPTRDQTMTAQAIVALSQFIERYPESEKAAAFHSLIDELTIRLHEKNFLNAYTYYKIQRYKSAVVAFKNALKRYPDTAHREDMMYYIVASYYKLAHNSIESKQSDRYIALLDSYYSFIGEFPESTHLKELKKYADEAKDYIDKNNTEKQE